MDEHHYWNEFYLSGDINSYLSYKKHQTDRVAKGQWELQN